MPGERRYEAARLYEEARVRRAEGNPSGAFARYHKLLLIADELEDLPWKAALMAEMGEMYQDAFDLLNARHWYTDALRLFRELRDEAQAGALLFRLAQVEQLSGALPAAEERYREAITQAERLSDARAEGQARVGLGQLLCEAGREPEGFAEAARGLRLLRGVGAAEAEAVLRQLREWRPRLGPGRYRRLVEAAAGEESIRRLLLD